MLQVRTGAGTIALRFATESSAKTAMKAIDTATNNILGLRLFNKEGGVIKESSR